MVSACSYIWLWATPIRQDEHIVELMQEDDDDGVNELVGNKGKPCPLLRVPVRVAHHSHQHLQTQEWMFMGHPLRILFCCWLDYTHSRSQMSLASPGAGSIAATIYGRRLFSSLIIYSGELLLLFSHLFPGTPARVNDFSSSTCYHYYISLLCLSPCLRLSSLP